MKLPCIAIYPGCQASGQMASAIGRVRVSCPAGRELYALAWVVEAASPAIARTLAGIEDVDSVAISVPDVPTVPTSALYGVFAQV